MRPVIFLALLLAACSSPHQLTQPRGPIVAANPGMWEPTPEDLKP